ncbi:MAG: hypothetical protein KDD61_04715 [Bdellovibrionales bacterium]|nr:hypothetical protein [Bdellovibrionales bacterium]
MRTPKSLSEFKLIKPARKLWESRDRLNQLPIWSIFVVFILLTWLFTLSSDKPAHSTSNEGIALSTFIPSGYTLIPLQIENAEVLTHLLGPFGVIDLYRVNQQKNDKPQLIARGIKLLRAPQVPEKFAALIPFENGHLFVGNHFRFFATLRQNSEVLNQFPKPKLKRKIITETIDPL